MGCWIVAADGESALETAPVLDWRSPIRFTSRRAVSSNGRVEQQPGIIWSGFLSIDLKHGLIPDVPVGKGRRLETQVDLSESRRDGYTVQKDV